MALRYSSLVLNNPPDSSFRGDKAEEVSYLAVLELRKHCTESRHHIYKSCTFKSCQQTVSPRAGRRRERRREMSVPLCSPPPSLAPVSRCGRTGVGPWCSAGTCPFFGSAHRYLPTTPSGPFRCRWCLSGYLSMQREEWESHKSGIEAHFGGVKKKNNLKMIHSKLKASYLFKTMP